MEIKEIFRRIWLISANETKSSDQPTQLIIATEIRHTRFYKTLHFEKDNFKFFLYPLKFDHIKVQFL